MAEKNYGKADIDVVLLGSLPNVQRNKVKHNFEISAHSWPVILNSPYFSPLLTENITTEDKNFSACFPSKRKLYINNYIKKGDGSSLGDSNTDRPCILWTPTDATEGITKDIAASCNEYSLQQPDEYTSDYEGPEWVDQVEFEKPPPDDRVTVENWKKLLDEDQENDEDFEEEADIEGFDLHYVEQRKVKDGLYWQIESESFLNENMPFWVTIKRMDSPPSKTHPTVLVISLGVEEKTSSKKGQQKSSGTQSFDIYLSNNNKPRLIDYYNGRGATDSAESGNSGAPTIEKEFDVDLARVLDTERNIEIGIMTVGARLIIFVNKVMMTYTRIVKTDAPDESGTIAEAKIAKGKIRIFGTNVQARINVSPMTFAYRGIMALPVPSVPPTIDPSSGDSSSAPKYYNVDNEGEIGNTSVCILPKAERDASGDRLYGVDCRVFNDDNGSSVSPSGGLGMHQNGEITFTKGGNLGIASSSSDFFVLIMNPDDTSFNPGGRGTFSIPDGGTPYFYRLKGGAETNTTPTSGGSENISSDVISVSENSEASDYFAISTSATVVLYNKDGKYDFLKTTQQGIQIKWGWGSASKKTLTGIVVSAQSSETPGMETLTISCEDYMYILKNTPIINSPFYDGMIQFYAIKDIVQRGGIQTVVNEWDGAEQFFLKAGFTFSKPKVRFSSQEKLYDCAHKVAEMGEATMYFDGDGIFRVKKLPGGLFSEDAGSSVVGRFTRDPSSKSASVILDEKSEEYSLRDTVNRISIFTLDRDSRNSIVYATDPANEGLTDALLYRRTGLIDQPAYGEYAVAVAYASELAKRVFFPIRKTSFRTTGDVAIILPLDFVLVDGLEYRVMGVSRKYEADSNNFITEYTCEWVGGA